jgi:competence protein ComEC
MLELTVWDVQHGLACYICTPNNRHIVVDLGIGSFGNNKPFSPILYLKNNLGIERLDYAVITHPHRDHLDDIFNFGELNPKTLLRPGHLTEKQIRDGNRKQDSEILDEYLRILGTYSADVLAGSASDSSAPAHWGGVKMSHFITPTCGDGNLNNHGIVFILEYAEGKIIIPGDNEPASWKELIKDKRFIEAAKNPDVLVAPHHGRESAYCSELFQAIGKPYITVISDGPECDTSATGNYGNQSKGWRVYYPDDSFEERYCVTTRKDGVIRVRAYYASDRTRRLNVHVQKGSAKTQ